MSENTRIRINIYTGEIEFEGTEEFVKNQLENLPLLMDNISKFIPKKQDRLQKMEEDTKPSKATITNEKIIPDSFGEWFNSFPTKLQQTEQVLIAACYQQNCSEQTTFETGQANKLLLEQGIKVSNAADSLKALQQSKHVFIVGKRGKLNVYRVSKDGVKFIETLKQKQ